MRGTVAFERLTCSPSVPSLNSAFYLSENDIPSDNDTSSTFVRIRLNDAVFRTSYLILFTSQHSLHMNDKIC